MSLQQRWGHQGRRNGLEDGGSEPMVREMLIIYVWKIGIYRTAKNVWILLISLNGARQEKMVA